jgi:signal transduction histidine kinase
MNRDALLGVERALSFSDLVQLVHDFKAPLSLVALETQVLQSQLDDGAHVEMVHATTRVLLNIDYIDRMVHDLIDSCALDLGRFALHCTPTELLDLVEGVTQRMATARDHDRLRLEASDRVTVNIDALRIERVTANLVHNALAYSNGGRVLVKLETTPRVARVSVRDTGPGISPDQLAHVFDAFRRAARPDEHEGSGLGLFVSKQIINAHGGHIGVDSLPGQGSEFYFELPLW